MENCAKQTHIAYVWWMQFYLLFSIPGKKVWTTLKNEWPEKADGSSTISAKRQSSSSVCLSPCTALRCESKICSDFTWFSYTLVLLGKSSSKPLAQSCTQCKTSEDRIRTLDKVRDSHTVDCDAQRDEKRLHRGSHGTFNQSDLAADQFSQGRKLKVVTSDSSSSRQANAVTAESWAVPADNSMVAGD